MRALIIVIVAALLAGLSSAGGFETPKIKVLFENSNRGLQRATNASCSFNASSIAYLSCMRSRISA
jgi:hypothetical protein